MILAGDVGGTKVHLALFDFTDGKLKHTRDKQFPAKEYAGLEEIVASPMSTLLVARIASRDDTIAGMTTLIAYRIPSGLHAVIEDVVVDESLRGHGVGATLISEAVQLARERGALHVNLTSRSSREAANRLYTRAGFVKRETNVYRLNLS